MVQDNSRLQVRVIGYGGDTLGTEAFARSEFEFSRQGDRSQGKAWIVMRQIVDRLIAEERKNAPRAVAVSA